MSNLPKGWRAILLNEVVDKIVGGGTPSKSVPSYYEGDIPWMTVKDMNKSYLTDTIDHITQEAIDNSSTNVIPAGTPIIATRMSLGKIVRASFDSAINQDLKALFVNREVDDYYFEYWYRSQGLKIESLGTGTTVKGVRLEVINALEFPLAPLAEQKRIVEKLDEVLAQVDTIKARLDGIPDLLKRFRQSILASAVSGKLTEEYGFERSEQFECKLKEVLDITSGIAFKKSQYSEEGSRLLQIANVGYGKAKWDKESFVSLDLAQEYKDFCLSDCDLVMALNRPITNGTLKIAKIESNDLPATLYQRVARLRVKEAVVGTLSLDYLFLCLRSSEFRKQVEANLKGSDQPYLNTSTLGELVIDTYSLDEQKEIVRLVDQYFAFADTIEAQVKKAQARVDNLTQSILAKAFRGELVEQDPNDEPANKLLERIAAARKEAEALAKAAKKAEAAKKRAVKASGVSKAAENS
ncbi:MULTISPECIES: restriction endonuclease subunit S [Vibrio]|uniref:restriction endonuclease subunit S n=1 Tax=Vibrio TaxID=662 RepID=UPI0020758921|nr:MULTISPECIES: restriction endonuclease subunit S [Vibrio]USD31265.1 restriction endonuclease subunit S [Vibrio sp. SCSIO 43186]USD44311.1 restriction endonuclease subunit S [Vibrio sp. SCSIO 43145]USD68388.1 restriction endonuclease subunit S [Vibrio sp. SCSIO 43139]USD96074.1 hypothetical protein CTT30_08270 [Vibrio coralliilyticus]